MDAGQQRWWGHLSIELLCIDSAMSNINLDDIAADRYFDESSSHGMRSDVQELSLPLSVSLTFSLSLSCVCLCLCVCVCV